MCWGYPNEVLISLWEGHSTCGFAAIMQQSVRFGDFHVFPQYGTKEFWFNRSSQNLTHMPPTEVYNEYQSFVDL